MRKIVDWVKNNPMLTALIMFMTVQTIVNVVLVVRMFQMQELLRKLILRLSLQIWSV